MVHLSYPYREKGSSEGMPRKAARPGCAVKGPKRDGPSARAPGIKDYETISVLSAAAFAVRSKNNGFAGRKGEIRSDYRAGSDAAVAAC